MGVRVLSVFHLRKRGVARFVFSTTDVVNASYFSHSNPNDPVCVAGQGVRQADYEFWSSVLPALDEDADTACMRLGIKTGKSAGAVARIIMGLHRLTELPQVKALQDANHLLDLAALIAIDQVMAKLGQPSKEVVAAIDASLARWFTPTKPNQVFPTTAQIRRRIRDLVKIHDDSIAVEDKRPKNRYSMMTRAQRATLELEVDSSVGIIIHEAIKAAAEKHEVSMAEALILLTTGKVEPEAARVVLHTYKADDVEDAPVYVEGHGWQVGDIPAQSTTVRDLSTKPEASKSYGPATMVRKYVEGRDGTCRAAGCGMPAWLCQLDHRINYADGGPTHPDNMVALCQHHHNMKTDGRAFYILDPDTGDVVWLFEDGTWAITEPSGPLAPKRKRWARTIAQDIEGYRTRKHREAQELKAELDKEQREAARQTEKAKNKKSEGGEEIPF